MVYNCIVKGCKSMYVPSSYGPSVSFHKFPKDEYRKKLWIQGLQLAKSRVYATARVCSRHFDESDFTTSGPGPTSARKLIETAVPTLIDNNEKESNGPPVGNIIDNDTNSNGPRSPLKVLIQENNDDTIECDECCSGSQVKQENGETQRARVELPILYVQRGGGNSSNSQPGDSPTDTKGSTPGQTRSQNFSHKESKSYQALNEEVTHLRKRVVNLQKMYKCKRWSEISQIKKIKKLEEKNKKLKMIVKKLKAMLLDCRCGDIYALDSIKEKMSDERNVRENSNTDYLDEYNYT